MSASAGSFRARVLMAQDARPTYPLASLGNPGLTLVSWRRRLRDRELKRSRSLMIGIYNASGCAIALLRWNGGRLDTFAAPPTILDDRQGIFDAANAAIDEVVSG